LLPTLTYFLMLFNRNNVLILWIVSFFGTDFTDDTDIFIFIRFQLILLLLFSIRIYLCSSVSKFKYLFMFCLPLPSNLTQNDFLKSFVYPLRNVVLALV